VVTLADVDESSAAGKQQVTVILGRSGTGTNLTYTIYMATEGTSAPSKEDHHGYSVQNCNTLPKGQLLESKRIPRGRHGAHAV